MVPYTFTIVRFEPTIPNLLILTPNLSGHPNQIRGCI
jgi:hypothetical protein